MTRLYLHEYEPGIWSIRRESPAGKSHVLMWRGMGDKATAIAAALETIGENDPAEMHILAWKMNTAEVRRYE